MGLCKNCHIYKKLGKDCWYFWEGKKTCSQFRQTEEDEPSVTSDDNNIKS
ncbi:hypothetical protein KY329_00605 [Candidatus Woesearchaeota archaeon]|nr:hypothetical protein [Candidatus Woesearchaeota archaeon]